MVNLDGLLHDDAVGTQPGASSHGHVDDGAITDIADVGLSVHGKRCSLPCRQLVLRHAKRSTLGGYVIGEGIGIIAGMPLAPKAVLHQVNPLDQGIAIKSCRQQVGQLHECFLKLRMFIARLAVLPISPAGNVADVEERDAIAQERRQGDLFGLKRSVRELNPKGNAQALAAGGVQRQTPDRIQIEAAGSRLHVAPIAANIQDVDEGQA